VPLVDLPPLGVLGANVAVWGAAHALSGYAVHRLPVARLQRDGRLLRLRRFEAGGRRYERALRIQRWKDRLPEAGDLFRGGVSKRRLPPGEGGGVERFVVETRRAELGHWLCLACLPLFPMWNPPLGVALMVAYGLAANLPCILVQRYNRGRCLRVLAARAERSRASSSGATPPA
jgi:glycosyl-4,4'-diaponeurosporenoate acyltransferase